MSVSRSTCPLGLKKFLTNDIKGSKSRLLYLVAISQSRISVEKIILSIPPGPNWEIRLKEYGLPDIFSSLLEIFLQKFLVHKHNYNRPAST